MALSLAAILGVLLITASSALAQVPGELNEDDPEYRYRVHGYLGVRGGGFFVADQQTQGQTGYLGNGAGLGLVGGIRLGPVVSLEANWNIFWHDESFDSPGGSVTYVDNIYIMGVTGDIKISIPTTGPFEPFLQAGAGYAYLGATYTPGGEEYDHIFAGGPTWHAGGGLAIWMGPYLTLEGRVSYRGIYFGDPSYDGGIAPKYENYVNGVMVDISAIFHL